MDNNTKCISLNRTTIGTSNLVHLDSMTSPSSVRPTFLPSSNIRPKTNPSLSIDEAGSAKYHYPNSQIWPHQSCPLYLRSLRRVMIPLHCPTYTPLPELPLTCPLRMCPMPFHAHQLDSSAVPIRICLQVQIQLRCSVPMRSALVVKHLAEISTTIYLPTIWSRRCIMAA